MKVHSDVACLFQLNGVNIVPGENKLTAEQYKAISTHEDFKELVSQKKIVVEKATATTKSEMNI